MEKFTTILLYGTNDYFGEKDALTTIPVGSTLSLDCYGINIKPITSTNKIEFINDIEISKSIIRFGGKIDIALKYYPKTLTNPVDYFDFIKHISKDYVYFKAPTYNLIETQTDFYRINITGAETTENFGGMIKSVSLNFEFGTKYTPET